MDQTGSQPKNKVIPVDVWDSETGEHQVRDLITGKRLKIIRRYDNGRIEGEWTDGDTDIFDSEAPAS
jgi:hypothetical protein